MLDLPINFRGLSRHVISMFLSGTLIFSNIASAAATPACNRCNEIPNHYEHEWFQRYFNSIDEDTPMGEVIDFMISFRASLEAKGVFCPPLLDILFNMKAWLANQGIEIEENVFNEIYQEVIKRDASLPHNYYSNLLFKDDDVKIETIKNKNKKKEHKKDKKEIKIKSKGVFGFLKCVAGALIFIVPIPGAQAVGSGLVLLGINDIVDAAHDQGEENATLQRLEEQRRIDMQQGISHS